MTTKKKNSKQRDKDLNSETADSKKGRRSEASHKGRNLAIIAGIIVAVIVVGAVASLSVFKSSNSAEALVINGIPCDAQEHTVYHTHAHLDIFVNGQAYEVPAGIGIEPSKCLFWLHTHSADGILHMESPENRVMTLGDLVDIWQKTALDVKGFQNVPSANSQQPSIYVDGQKADTASNYRDSKIFPNTEIAMIYGSPPSKIPSSYVYGKTDFKAGDSNSDIITSILAPSTPGSGPLGDKNAPVTIVEFGDYQCNSCEIFHKETKDAVMTKLVDTGKAKFLFKDFTLNDYILQPIRGSTLAAEAAYCAGEQGKFWQYHNELYDRQRPEGTVWVSEQVLKGFASNVAVSDLDQFSSCLDSHKYQATVDANNRLVQSLGINATPTFIIIPAQGGSSGNNPVKLVGAYPYQAFETVVNQLSAAS